MNVLTATESRSNLATLSERIAIGLGNLKNHDVSASFCIALFLCLLFMVGILGDLRICWFRDPVYQPNMSATQSLVTFGGGIAISLTELAMLQHRYKQNSSSTHTPSLNVRLKSFFILVDSHRKIISTNLDFSQALDLKAKTRHSVIKFQCFQAQEVSV